MSFRVDHVLLSVDSNSTGLENWKRSVILHLQSSVKSTHVNTVTPPPTQPFCRFGCGRSADPLASSENNNEGFGRDQFPSTEPYSACRAVCQFKTTTERHRGVGGIPHCLIKHRPSVHNHTELCVVACDTRSRVYPCTLMCFHTIYWFCSPAAHFEAALFEAAPFPLSSSSSLCFLLHVFQWRKAGICQNLSFLLSGMSGFFLVCFEDRWHGNSLSPDTPVVQKMSKQVEIAALAFWVIQSVRDAFLLQLGSVSVRWGLFRISTIVDMSTQIKCLKHTKNPS